MRRRWIFTLLLIIFIWLVVSNLPGIQRLGPELSKGRWQWLLAAVLAQVMYYLLYAGVYQSAFTTVGVRTRFSELIPVIFASIFTNVAAPTGEASGAALFADDAARRGESPTRATAGVLLVHAADYFAFTLVLAFNLVHLLATHPVQTLEIAGAVTLLVIFALLSGLMLLGLRRPSLLASWLGRYQSHIESLAKRLHRRSFLPEDWAQSSAKDFSTAALAIGAHPSQLRRSVLIALGAYSVDLVSLNFVFLAFHQPIHLSTLISGFATGTLFWLIAITPEGIGVVEGVMALVYTWLGVPASAATVVALSFRGLTFWIPLVAGFFALRRIRSFSYKRAYTSDEGSVRLVALLTGLMGILNLLSSVRPTLPSRLMAIRNFLPLEVRHGTHLATALAGFALILLASNLWRRKRVGWALAIAILMLSSLTHLARLEYEGAILAGGLALWLFSMRAEFHAHSDPPSIRQGLRVLGAALLFTLAYGMLGFYLLDRHFSVQFGPYQAFVQTIMMFTQFADPGIRPLTSFGRFFADSIYFVGAATTGYAMVMLARPVLIRQPASETERKHAAEIVERYGCSSLARLTLFEDKSYFFSQGGSVIAFVVKGRIALALGDPIGPDDDFPVTLQEFKVYCSHNDWQPAFYQVLPDHLDEYRRAGFSSLCIGHEAIVHLNQFTLEGSRAKPLRNIVNKLIRLGYRASIHLPPIGDELLAELRRISNEWLTVVHGTEKRFSLGWFEDNYIRSSRIMTIQSADGTIVAFATILPEYQRNEIGVDLMRRLTRTEPGTMDFLFVSLIQWAREQGYETFNLGLSALAGVGLRDEDPAVERAMHYIFEHVNQFYNFKGLHAFKQKFDPEWSPRYLIYPGPAALPAIAIALVRADSGDDFLWEFMK